MNKNTRINKNGSQTIIFKHFSSVIYKFLRGWPPLIAYHFYLSFLKPSLFSFFLITYLQQFTTRIRKRSQNAVDSLEIAAISAMSLANKGFLGRNLHPGDLKP
jgi:hypothetical protein